ncbi:MAG: prolyl oligopeptidase family serine peptidase [Opitutus sp.]
MRALRLNHSVTHAAFSGLRGFAVLTGLLALAASLVAVEPARRPLAHTDFDGWRSIDSSTLSSNGAFLGYSYMPQEGDGELIIRELASGLEQRVPVGALPPAPTTASDRDPERPAPRRSVSLSFTDDARFAVATTFPELEATRAARRAGRSTPNLPPEGLVIVNLVTRDTTRISGVKSFQVPSNGGAWLAWLRTARTQPVEPGSSTVPGAQSYGTELVLRNLATTKETAFPDVVEYSFARDGRTLLFTTSSPVDSENGVYAVTPGDTPSLRPLLKGPGRYQKLAWDRRQTQAAFLADHSDAKTSPVSFAVYRWSRGEANASAVVRASTSGVPAGSTISADVTPSFSPDGLKLYVSTAPIPVPRDRQLTNLPEEEQVSADLWRWNDEFIQPLQKVRADKERKRAYAGVIDLAAARYTQIGDVSLPEITFSDDGGRAVGYDDRPYRSRIDYDGIYQDAYLINPTNGVRQLIARELDESAGLRWSPNGRWIAYYQNREWFAFDVETSRTVPLTRGVPVPFYDELNDLPQASPPYGTAGWSSNGASLLIYDRFDVWQVFPDGGPARNITAGFGRTEKIQLRVQSIDPPTPDSDVRGIDLARPLILRGESERTRATGFFRTTFNADAAPTRLLWDDKNFRYVARARDQDTLLVTASRFAEFPDLQTTDATFSPLKKVSNGGAQLTPFLWGTDELIHYRSTDGVELDAMLCKPANFDPRKKYPMIVYIYERLSANLHRFFEPAPLAVIEPSFYTSNGYIVLMPDIAYLTGHPGQSSYRCVMPAVDEVVRRGFVDEAAIGLEGHSWGGYETAYLITQTKRFRAAQAGAIVSNMASAYGAIGESSGRSRQFKYEKTQSRIGVSPQEAPLLYVENSPVFFAPQVTTPLLILHDDHDDVVPWPQAVEYFLALRRAGKEVYLINYNNEFHSPRRRAAREDFARRMHQFFDHFLKGAPAPAWMTGGIPYLERDAEKIRFRQTP